MGLDKLIAKVEAVDEHHVRFTLSCAQRRLRRRLGDGFRLDPVRRKYADAMLVLARRNTSTLADRHRAVALRCKQDSLIRYIANPHYRQGSGQHLIFGLRRIRPAGQAENQRMPDHPRAAAGNSSPAIKADGNLQLHDITGLNVGYLAFNICRKPFDNLLGAPGAELCRWTSDRRRSVQRQRHAGQAAAAGHAGLQRSTAGVRHDPRGAQELPKQAGLEQGFETDIWSMPVQRPTTRIQASSPR
ncbi:hypothetical protein M8494_21765 [Serratia ureilytica]